MGTAYGGSQVQNNAPTIQGEFQQALKQVLGELPDVKCCSRTDAGVHANQFCISFHTEKTVELRKLPLALNNYLPRDIRVMCARNVPQDFHARYSCLGKEYVYKIYNRSVMDPFFEGRAHQFYVPINEKELDEIAQVFVGRHDFAAFCCRRTDQTDTVRTVSHCRVERKGDLVTVRVAADGFLYNMVRIIVGTLLNAARGKLTAADIRRIMDSKKRENLCATAPANGLYLNEVYYDLPKE